MSPSLDVVCMHDVPGGSSLLLAYSPACLLTYLRTGRALIEEEQAAAIAAAAHGEAKPGSPKAQAKGQAQRHDHPRKAQHGGCPAHILFHQQHARRGLDVETPGIKAYPLAHQRQRRPGRAPAQVDQPGRTSRGTADGVDHGQVLRQKIRARRHGDRRPRRR